MPDSYLWIKSLHILGAVLFYGNILVTSWWKHAASRHGHPRVLAFAQKQVFVTDLVFTTTGSVLLLVTGVGNAHLHGSLPIDTPWMMTSLYLFMASGLIWGLFMIPVQLKQSRLAKDFDDHQPIPAEYWRLEKRWHLIGAIAKLFPLAIIVVMVFKPA